MSITLAFDIYGTLLDIYGANKTLEKIVGDKSLEFSHTWRDKQLEYSFRRALMNKYEIFSVCVSDALDYTCMYYKKPLTKEEKQELLNAYSSLPAFNDVISSLKQFNDVDYRLYAFSNGSVEMIETLLTTAGIRDYFLGIVSVDGVKSFKPDPAVYHHFISESAAVSDQAWLVSSNPFDVIGAISAGMKAVWVKRFENKVFDPWGIEPTLTIKNLNELKEKIDEYYSNQ
ncbi:MAG: 2-haloacid dehalogenase [Gammaproteobacteria bacterium]|jgi:2-haloacid dehalogenase